MQVIQKAHENTRKILGKAKKSGSGYRLMTYVLTQKIDSGWLMFHVLTCEFLLLTNEEYKKLYELPELYEKWFIVPNNLDDMMYADQVRFINKTVQKKKQNITNYTILTTTDCNARCFYCYEMGCKRIAMSEQMAHKVADYIENNCGKEKVKLAWFGGEPLFNKKVINIICKDLDEKGIEYSSSMISNGYLFDEATVKEAATLWKLKWVQITLDGTENVYNKSKAFIYKENTSPYQIVLSNIASLIKAGIYVLIRLNLSEQNGEDLLALIEELHTRFANEKNLAVYSHVLFQFSGNHGTNRPDEQQSSLYQKQRILQGKLREYKLQHAYPLPKKPRLNWCMADSGISQMILPDGNIGLCEHYTEDHYIGTIEKGVTDNDKVLQFQKMQSKQKECDSCVNYPNCIRLEKCFEQQICTVDSQQEKKQKLIDDMDYTYQHWMNKKGAFMDDHPEIC